MSVPIKLSVVIITYNEQRNIADCIDSVIRVADDIVVVDSGSTDLTRNIAEEKGAKVVVNKFIGHIEQKNFAITQAKYEYILSIDADERLDEEFIQQILAVKRNWTHDGYSVNRLNNYCGTWIRHGAWYPDIKLRLWNSKKGKWGGTNPHDKFELEPNCKSKHLNGNLLHYSYQTINEHHNKTIYFATIAANAYYLNGRRSSFFKICFSPLFRFVRDYFFKRGLLDGKYGFIIAKITALEVYQKYKLLKQLNQH